MAVNSKAKKILPALYLRGPVEAITISYFLAKKEETNKELNEIAIDLQLSFGWDEDDYPVRTIIQTYYRMLALMRQDKICINEILNNGGS